MPKIKKICNYCGIEFERYRSTFRPNQKYFFCCVEHKKKFNNENNLHSGENNGNYGKKWNKNQRKKMSNQRKNKVPVIDLDGNKFLIDKNDPLYKSKKVIAESKGRTLSYETKQKMSDAKKGITNTIKYTPELRAKIGKASSNKFTPEYKKRFRKIMEESGRWTPLKDKSDLEIYNNESNWKEKMFDRCSEKEKQLLKEFKVFNCRTNSKGVVRDHKYSRHSGFKNGVFPKLINHPCNCEIITHSDNIKKRQSKNIKSSSITLNELFKQIEKFNGIWKYQDECLQLINDYKNGQRWSRKNY